MQRTLNQLLKDATYSHDNIYDWLKTILNDWTIKIKINFRFADL